MQGNPDAQHELGNAYDSGTAGLHKDLKKAAFWSEKAARQGASAAQVNTSIAYHYGDGVVQNTEVAMTWLDRAVKSGDAGAEYNVGVVYQFGDGRPQGLGLARYWLELAAERGIEDAKEVFAELGESSGNLSGAIRRVGHPLVLPYDERRQDEQTRCPDRTGLRSCPQWQA